MATRLYPSNNAPALLEKLAGVPSGTFGRLQEIEGKHPKRNLPTPEGYEEADAFYKTVFASPDLNRLDNFMTFGWGRLTTEATRLIKRWGQIYYGGGVDDPAKVSELLQAQGVTLPSDVTVEQLGGVYWG